MSSTNQIYRRCQWIAVLILPLSIFAQSPAGEVQERIRKVENSLSPDIIYGDTIPLANLEQRMKATNTKGLSIAVINNYQIEWAKGYGWANEGEERKVTTNTRFQVASISKRLNSLGILKLLQKGKLDPPPTSIITSAPGYSRTIAFRKIKRSIPILGCSLMLQEK